MIRDLLDLLSIDDLLSILYAVATRLAWRGQLTIVDVVVIKDLAGETPNNLDRAA